MGLKDKVAVVTGGSRSIGRASAPRSARDGALCTIPGLRDGGRVINPSSSLSRWPMARATACCTTEAAIDAFAAGPAAELGHPGITVSTPASGLTDTQRNAEMRAADPKIEATFSATTARGRIGTVQDNGDSAALIASPAAGWASGRIDPMGDFLLQARG